MAPETLPTFALPGRVIITLEQVAVAWSKTSFAVTLLHVVVRKTDKRIVHFATVTVNLLLGVTALLPWTACRPLA